MAVAGAFGIESFQSQLVPEGKFDIVPEPLSKDKEYINFFNDPTVNNYMNSTNEFNSMMKKIYSAIENELLK